jgi:hypothetical protein
MSVFNPKCNCLGALIADTPFCNDDGCPECTSEVLYPTDVNESVKIVKDVKKPGMVEQMRAIRKKSIHDCKSPNDTERYDWLSDVSDYSDLDQEFERLYIQKCSTDVNVPQAEGSCQHCMKN